MTPSINKEAVGKIFAKYRSRYGQLWTSRASCDDDWEFIIDDWCQELSKFSIGQVRCAFTKTLSLYKDYPPTLGQMVDLCLQESGVPSMGEVISLMTARNFRHPVVKLVYDKIGSWTLSHGSEFEIEKKTKEHYEQAVASFHVEPQKAWAMLENHNAQPKQIEPLPKIPSKEERLSFSERMEQYKRLAEDGKTLGKDDMMERFPREKIRETSRSFDYELFREYKKYLMSVPEPHALKLSAQHAYDRRRFLSEAEQPALLKRLGFRPEGRVEEKSSERRSNGPQKVFKDWHSD